MDEKRKTDTRVPGGLRHYLAWARSQITFGYKKWNSKRIAFVSVLISISVVFFIISVRILPVSALPSFKFAFIGLPIKITGFIFGPIVGVVTGVLSDLISFILVPTYYHYLYTIAIAIAGFVPGFAGYWFFNVNEMFFSSKYKISKFKETIQFFKKQYEEALIKGNAEDIQYFSERIAYYEVKVILLENKSRPNAMINFSFISALVIIVMQVGIIFYIFTNLNDSLFIHNRFVKNKYFYLLLTTSGFGLMGIFMILYRVFLCKRFQTFIELMAIISFSAIIEFINTFVLSMADTLTLKTDFWVNLTTQSLFGPFKIFFNIVIILATYKVVSPLIRVKEGNNF